MNADSLSFEQLCELFNYTPKNRPLSTDEIAEFFGVARNTLEQHRLKGTGSHHPALVASATYEYLEAIIVKAKMELENLPAGIAKPFRLIVIDTAVALTTSFDNFTRWIR